MRKITRNVICACCGKVIEVTEIISRYIVDSGLDQRPEHEGLLIEINECPHCHYCAQEISKFISEDVKNIVFSDKYQEIMKSDYEDLVDRKIKAAAKLAESRAEKIMLYLTSCWHLEFQQKIKEAAAMRKKAVVYMEKEIEGEPPIELVFMYLDSLRQLGEFDKSFTVISEIGNILYQNLDPDDFLLALFRYEVMLIEQRDALPHLLSEVKS